jgi:hypothetical protein
MMTCPNDTTRVNKGTDGTLPSSEWLTITEKCFMCELEDLGATQA